MKIQDLIFSREKNRKIGTTFFLFSQYGLREATLYGISVSFLRETTIGVSYFYGNVSKKSESLTAVPTKSDSDVLLCLQLLSKTLTCTLHLS